MHQDRHYCAIRYRTNVSVQKEKVIITNIVRSQGRKQQCQDCVYDRTHVMKGRGKKRGGRHSNFDIIQSKRKIEREQPLEHTHTCTRECSE